MAFQSDNQDAAYTIDELKALIVLYCEHLSGGLGKTSFVDCDYRTIESAIENHADVLQTEKRNIATAVRQSRKYWEKQGQGLVNGSNSYGNATAWIFNMKNRFPDEWKDKSEVENTIDLNQPVIINRTIVKGE